MARDYLDSGTKYRVVGGFLSPVSDGYKKKGLLPTLHRVPMCKLSIKDSDWIDVDTWEAEEPEWTRTKVVLETIEERVNKKEIRDKYTNGRKIKVMMVSGGDLVGSFLTPGLWDQEDLRDIINKFGLLIIERHGTDLSEVVDQSPLLQEFSVWLFFSFLFFFLLNKCCSFSFAVFLSLQEHIHIIHQPIKNDLSSTRVRSLLSQGQSVRYLVPDGTCNYIAQHGLYKVLPN